MKLTYVSVCAHVNIASHIILYRAVLTRILLILNMTRATIQWASSVLRWAHLSHALNWIANCSGGPVCTYLLQPYMGRHFQIWLGPSQPLCPEIFQVCPFCTLLDDAWPTIPLPVIGGLYKEKAKEVHCGE